MKLYPCSVNKNGENSSPYNGGDRVAHQTDAKADKRYSDTDHGVIATTSPGRQTAQRLRAGPPIELEPSRVFSPKFCYL